MHRLLYILPLLFFFPFSTYAQSVNYTLSVPTVGLTSPLLVANDVTCSGVGGWSKNPTYSAPGGVPTITAENTYKFTGGSNLYTSLAAAKAQFGSDSSYIFHCANPTKIVWFNYFGIVLGDSQVQATSFDVDDGSFNTRFTGVHNVVISTSTSVLTFDVSQYVDPTEVDINNPSRFITGHVLTYAINNYDPSSITHEYNTPGTPFATGYSTTSMQTSQSFTTDGVYTFLVNFANPDSFFNDVTPFSGTNLYFDITVSGGVVTDVNVDIMTNEVVPTGYVACSFTDLGGCLVNTLRYLFVPSQGSVNSLTSVVSSSTIPFVNQAYEYYRVLNVAVSMATATPATSSLNYRFQIPEAGIDVEMFSAALVTQNLGDAGDIFRAIALALLYLSFWLMIISSIQNKMGVSFEAESREYGTGGTEHNRANSIRRKN